MVKNLETINYKNVDSLWQLMETVYDPEVPVLSIVDLGIVRHIISNENGTTITVTPTYSGCPAMDMIAMNIKLALAGAGIRNVNIKSQLSPAWTTDWMTEEGKKKLKDYGIAPPIGKSFDKKFLEQQTVPCPLCHSQNTRLISQFGSTSCKALYQCSDCREPFDYFKCH